MAPPRLFRTRTSEMMTALRKAKIPFSESKGTNAVKKKFGAHEYPLQTGDDFPVEQSFVSVGGEPLKREAFVFEADSEKLDAIYKKLHAEILEYKNPPAEQKKIALAMQAVRKVFTYDNEEYQAWNGSSATADDEKSGIIPFDTFITKGKGKCRHFAPLTAYLIKRLIKDGLLPKGKVHIARDVSVNNKSHTWVVYRPYHMKTIDAYLVDSTLHDTPYLIKADMKELREIYKDAIDNCVFRYLGSWCPEPDMEFSYDVDHQVYRVKMPQAANPTEFKFVKNLGSGSFGTVHQISAGNQAYAVKEFIFTIEGSTRNWPSQKEFEKYMLWRFQRAVQEARFNHDLDGVGASFCTLAPVQIDWNKLAGTFKVKSYPQVVSIMKLKAGVTFDEFKVTSSEQFLKLAAATLRAVQAVHKKFLHLDIHSRNLLVSEDKDKNITVEMVDTGLCQYPGRKLRYIRQLTSSIKPPEYKGKDSYHATVAQDVHGVGLVLQKLLNRELFQPPMDEEVDKILNDMLKDNPAERISIDEALKRFAEISQAEQKLPAGQRKKVIRLVLPPEKKLPAAAEIKHSLQRMPDHTVNYDPHFRVAVLSAMVSNAVGLIYGSVCRLIETLEATASGRKSSAYQACLELKAYFQTDIKPLLDLERKIFTDGDFDIAEKGENLRKNKFSQEKKINAFRMQNKILGERLVDAFNAAVQKYKSAHPDAKDIPTSAKPMSLLEFIKFINGQFKSLYSLMRKGRHPLVLIFFDEPVVQELGYLFKQDDFKKKKELALDDQQIDLLLEKILEEEFKKEMAELVKKPMEHIGKMQALRDELDARAKIIKEKLREDAWREAQTAQQEYADAFREMTTLAAMPVRAKAAFLARQLLESKNSKLTDALTLRVEKYLSKAGHSQLKVIEDNLTADVPQAEQKNKKKLTEVAQLREMPIIDFSHEQDFLPVQIHKKLAKRCEEIRDEKVLEQIKNYIQQQKLLLLAFVKEDLVAVIHAYNAINNIAIIIDDLLKPLLAAMRDMKSDKAYFEPKQKGNKHNENIKMLNRAVQEALQYAGNIIDSIVQQAKPLDPQRVLLLEAFLNYSYKENNQKAITIKDLLSKCNLMANFQDMLAGKVNKPTALAM